MRFMMLMIPKGYESAEPGADAGRRGRGRDDEVQRGPAERRRAAGARRPAPALDGRAGLVRGGKPLVTDGPFAEAKEVLGGYWMIEVGSKEEAIAWAKRCPASENEVIEIRQVQEMSDFPDDVQEAAAGFAEMQEEARRRRA